MADAQFYLIHHCSLQITRATTPRAPKMMRSLLAGALGGLPPTRVRDISDVMVTFLKVWLRPKPSPSEVQLSLPI